MKEVVYKNSIIYEIGSKEYKPPMPKHWYAFPVQSKFPADVKKLYNPVTTKTELGVLFEFNNYKILYFKDNVVFYEPIIATCSLGVILPNKDLITREKALAIRNWQIHTRCFDYTECPLL